jgi:hypothetical protein
MSLAICERDCGAVRPIACACQPVAACSSSMLAFEWVRLAQRIPVRVAFAAIRDELERSQFAAASRRELLSPRVCWRNNRRTLESLEERAVGRGGGWYSDCRSPTVGTSAIAEIDLNPVVARR